MATRIRASCTDCGDVELKVKEIMVRVCADDDSGSYVFRCPTCTLSVVKEAEPRVVDLLLASGVELQTWRLPAELLETKSGACFTHDDLLDFHDLLQDEKWFDRFLHGVTDPNSGTT
jgi:hypothetical protein